MSICAFVGVRDVQALCAHRCVYKGSVCTYVCGQDLCACTHTYMSVGMHKQGLCVHTDVQSPCAQVCVHMCVHRSMGTCVCMRVCAGLCAYLCVHTCEGPRTHVCVCRSTCTCVCVCAGLCAHVQFRVHAHVGPGRGSWPRRAAGTADALFLPSPPFSHSTPASRPPEGPEAEWKHRYRSVLLGPCLLLHGARLACALELPGHLWEQPGCGASLPQPGALCPAPLCLRWHPEPGLGAEKGHSEKSSPMQAQSRQCAHCALLQPARSCACWASWLEEGVTFVAHAGEPGELPSQLTSLQCDGQGSPLPCAQWSHAWEMCPAHVPGHPIPALLSRASLELLMLSQHRMLQACAWGHSHRGVGPAALLV